MPPRPAPRPPVAAPADVEVEAAAPRRERVDVEALCARWRSAIDAAETALRASDASLPARDRAARSGRIAEERQSVLELLRELSRAEGASPRFLHLIPQSRRRWALGLPSNVTACVFNLDGVLIGSAALHLAAWEKTFNEFIWARAERTGGRFALFSAAGDYRQHIHAKPRLDGVRSFLASRGVSLPEGDPGDPPGAETVHGLANRKNEILRRRIDEQGVTAYEGSFHYLQTAREAGIRTAVISASANTHRILDRSGLTSLIDVCIDGNAIAAEQLRVKPAPDTLLAACRRLGVDPGQAAAFETGPAGVAAARAGGFAAVVGVAGAGRPDALRAEGADLVVPSLAELLERRLAA